VRNLSRQVKFRGNYITERFPPAASHRISSPDATLKFPIHFESLTLNPGHSSSLKTPSISDNMELQEAHRFVQQSVHEIANTFQKLPGSAMLIRYIQSSYQNDPVRSAIELILVIFFVRYLLASSYATHSGNFVTLTEEVGAFRNIRHPQS